ncbi:beta-N-acetylhexosaminidase [Oceanirhabdus sp. W0125-5]|uniref:beta-N-acetylhexosaminidase n=1 Tax=Oceanirhabdus sp. W0125-5 TaxID=2999116 RepID=UPI0022F2B2C9|nr:beta-N-acetylhexosaminidase [Oceanirhabdus sp. W0125-5]WBW94730.1 beta-N-acetylhexosaminidase [Oceanirhabdus sp. W0125-5]
MKKILCYILLLSCIILASCNMEEKNKINHSNDLEEKIKEDEKSEKDIIEEIIESMTLEEKVGQMIIGGFNGTKMNEELRNKILDKKLGGVILFNRNITDREQLLTLNNELNKLNNKIGLFVSVDEEGGRVSRLPKDKIPIPSSYKIGQLGNPDLCKDIGEVIGEELKMYGFNMDFAPVIDIWSNKQNKVIGDRAFGNNAEIVSKCGVSMIKGFKEKNIISVVKHFPGHGDTIMDSHKGLPVLEYGLEDLKKRELIPFIEAINNEVDGIMVGHLMLPQVDNSGYPASLSKIFIKDLLRNKLGYNGLIITDDMEMGAIKNNFGIKEASTKAVKAGVDILLVCHTEKSITAATQSIIEAVKNQSISLEQIEESVKRILKTKEKYGILDYEQFKLNVVDYKE